MRVQIQQVLGSYRVGSDSAWRDMRYVEHDGLTAKVLRVRPGVGRGWFQVQVRANAQYCDAMRCQIVCESEADAQALDRCTPAELPEFVQVG